MRRSGLDRSPFWMRMRTPPGLGAKFERSDLPDWCRRERLLTMGEPAHVPVDANRSERR